MTVEHLWSASGGASDASCGELLPGASRAFVRDRSTGPGTNQVVGRLAIITTDSSTSFVPFRVVAYDSAGTFVVGTAWLDEHANGAGTGYWLRQSGSLTGNSTGTGTISATFGTPYQMAPATIFLTSSNYSWHFTVKTSTATGFTSTFSSRAGASGTAIVYWESLGTASSVSY